MNKSHRFEHPAMNTVFTLRFQGCDENAAARLASACIAEIDRHEDILSRYREGSDIARINQLKENESLLISEECWQCLRTAFEVYMETGGLFDVSAGARYEHWKRNRNAHGEVVPLIRGQLQIHPDRPLVYCEVPGRQLDLGGIGKGYTLDRLSALITELHSGPALLAAGNSTCLAIGDQRWEIQLADDTQNPPLMLQQMSLSASGTTIQGAHVLHPEDGAPSELMFQRVWVSHPEAARSDAFATACLLMNETEVRAFFDATPSIPQIILQHNNGSYTYLSRQDFTDS